MIQGFVSDAREPGQPFPAPVNPSNTRPTASIISPIDGSTFPDTGSITFTGIGSDPEDGQLSGNSLVWPSSVDGQIGVGNSFDGTLTVGSHLITLRAMDSLGDLGSASVTVTVNEAPANSAPTASINIPDDVFNYLTTDAIDFV